MNIRRYTLIMAFAIAAVSCGYAEDTESEVKRLRQELEQTKRQMEEQRKAAEERIKRLEEIVNRLTSEKAGPPQAPAKQEEGKSALEKEVEEFLKKSAPQKPQEAPSATQKILGLPDRLSLGLGGVSQVFNPDISAIGDFLFHYTSSGADEYGTSKFLFRELELGFQAPIDPFARADAFVAIHKHTHRPHMHDDEEHEHGYEVHLEEAYVTLLTLPYDLQARVGKFLASFGKTNTRHLHELAWVDQPLVVRNYFGEEGLAGEGVSVSWLVPNPWNKYIELTYELFNNDSESLFAGHESNNVVQLAHLRTVLDLTKNTTLELGGSAAVAPNTQDSARWTVLEGADMTLKWRHPTRGLYKSLTWQTEVLLAQKQLEDGGTASTWGMYSSLEYQFARQWKAAVRYDFSQLPDLSDFHETAASAYLTFMQSEYCLWRLGYQFAYRDYFPHEIKGDRGEHTVFLQLNFGIGPHRAHKY